MAGGRIRTLKPEWAEDERLAAASDAARVLSVVLILLADDHGNGRAHPAYLASRGWPYGDPKAMIDKATDALLELATLRFVELYDAVDQRYYHIRNWTKHQRVDKVGTGRVPMFCESSRVSPDKFASVSGQARECLAPDLRSPISDHDRDHDQEMPANAGSGPGGPAVRSEASGDDPPSESTAPPPASEPARPAPLVLLPTSAADSPVQRVWAAHVEAWKAHNHSGRPPVLSDDRAKLIRARLKTYPPEDLIAAVRNVFRSPFHVDNRHTSVDLVLRNAKQVEYFRDFRTPPSGPRSSVALQRPAPPGQAAWRAPEPMQFTDDEEDPVHAQP